MIFATPALIAALALTDLTGDGAVNGADIALVISAWGTSAGDVTGDGHTDGADLTRVLNNFGLALHRNDAGDGSLYLTRNAAPSPSPLGPVFMRWTETDSAHPHTFTRWQRVQHTPTRVTITVYPRQSIDERKTPG